MIIRKASRRFLKNALRFSRANDFLRGAAVITGVALTAAEESGDYF